MASTASTASAAGAAAVRCFFHAETNTCQYVVSDPATSAAALIDTVYDYDAAAARFSTGSADALLAYCAEAGLRVQWVLDTHAHADHVTAADYLRRRTGAPYGIGEHITTVQRAFSELYNLSGDAAPAPTVFDRLFADGDEFALGSLRVRVMHTPGHTPACVSYVVGEGDAVFVGDTIFMPDFGSARCDFPHGSAHKLFESIQRRLFSLPDATRVFVGHDYAPGGRAIAWESTIGEQKAANKHVSASADEQAFVQWRTSRDKELGPPRLLLPSLQVNIRGGALPAPDGNGISYLRLPINKF